MLTVSDTALEIKDLKVTNKEITTYFLALPMSQRLETFLKVLEMGVIVCSRITASSDLDYVEKKLAETTSVIDVKFQKLTSDLQSLLNSALNPVVDSSYLGQASKVLHQQSQSISNNLTQLISNTQLLIDQELSKLTQEYRALDSRLDPHNTAGYVSILLSRIVQFEQCLNSQFVETDTASFVGKLRTLLETHFGQNGAILQLLETKLRVDFEGTTPLGQVFHGLKAEIASLRDAVMQHIGQQTILEQTTQKGFVFEDKVFDHLQIIAKPHGDRVDDVTLKAEAITQSKKGDYIYIFSDTNKSVVLDAKNYNRLKSLPAMLTYIKDAMQERNANFGIIVAPTEESLQKQIGAWNVYGSIIITCLDHIDVALKYAKYSMELQSSEASNVNVALLRYKLSELDRKLRDITTIKSKLTKMTNGIISSTSELHTLLDDLKYQIGTLTSEIDDELKKTNLLPLQHASSDC